MMYKHGRNVLCAVVLGFTAAVGLVSTAFAAGDSSSDAPGGFTAVKQSTAVIIAVPIDAQGRENVSAATMHLYSGAAVRSSDDLRAAFAQGVDVTNAPRVTSGDIQHDSSTCGWYGGDYGYGA